MIDAPSQCIHTLLTKTALQLKFKYRHVDTVKWVMVT